MKKDFTQKKPECFGNFKKQHGNPRCGWCKQSDLCRNNDKQKLAPTPTKVYKLKLDCHYSTKQAIEYEFYKSTRITPGFIEQKIKEVTICKYVEEVTSPKESLANVRVYSAITDFESNFDLVIATFEEIEILP